MEISLKNFLIHRLNKKNTENYKHLIDGTKHYCLNETKHTKAFIETVKKAKNIFPIITNIDQKMFEVLMLKILNIAKIV